MKNVILSLVCFMVAFSVSAQTATGEREMANASQSDGPVLVLEATEVNFGEIIQDSEPFRKLAFTNAGTAPLIIKNAKGSCGCTVPTWPKEPIMPGQTDTLSIRYDTKRIGKINKTVTLYTNAGEAPVTIAVRGNISPKPKEPEALPAKSPSILGGEKSGNN